MVPGSVGFLDRIKRTLTARSRGERDAPAMNAGPRDVGAEAEDEQETFVGRAGEDEAGDAGDSGAERRAGGQPGAGDGAARDT